MCLFGRYDFQLFECPHRLDPGSVALDEWRSLFSSRNGYAIFDFRRDSALSRIFLKKPLVKGEGAVRFRRERGFRERTSRWRRMKEHFEDERGSSAFFAVGATIGGGLVAVGRFPGRGVGRSEKEFQNVGRHCGPLAQAGGSAGGIRYRLFSGYCEGCEDAGDQGRLHSERSAESNVAGIVASRGETSEVGSLSHKATRGAGGWGNMNVFRIVRGRAASPRPPFYLSSLESLDSLKPMRRPLRCRPTCRPLTHLSRFQ